MEENAEDTDETEVGVITGMEDLTGEIIDTTEIDSTKRNEWIDHFETKLTAIDGVETAWGAGNTITNCQTGQFELTISHEYPEHGNGVILNGNLRSIGQQISNILDTRLVASYEIVMQPQALKDSDRHTHPSYIIEFDLR